MTAETDIAAVDTGGSNTAAEVRTAMTSILARADHEVHWATSYGVTADGSTNDTTALQDGFDNMGEGEVMVLPPGDVVFDHLDIEQHGTKVFGWGTGDTADATNSGARGTRLLYSGNGTPTELVRVQHTSQSNPLGYVELHNLSIDGNNKLGTGIDGLLFRSFRGLLNNVATNDCSGDGIVVQGYATWDTYDTRLLSIMSHHNSGAGLNFTADSPDCHIVQPIIFSNNGGGVIVSSGSQQFADIHTYGNAPNNFLFIGGSRTKITNLKCENATQHGILFDGTAGSGASDIQIVCANFKDNGQAANNTYDHIAFLGTNDFFHPMISNAVFRSGIANKVRYGVNLDSTTDAVLTDCNFVGSSNYGTSPVNLGGATDPMVRHNQNFVTENNGTATVASGNTSITVNHGLGLTPTLQSITATPTNNLGSATKFWISGVTSTQFVINVNAAPGGSGATFVWRADRL